MKRYNLLFIVLLANFFPLISQNNLWITDRFGNDYSLDQIASANPSSYIPPTVYSCVAGYFQLDFYSTTAGLGFDEPTLSPVLPLGQVRMNTICKAFEDLSALIEQTTSTPGVPSLVRLKIKSGITSGSALATGTPFFTGPAGVPPPVYYGEVWNTINTGMDSYWQYSLAGVIPPGLYPYHGQIVFSETWAGNPEVNAVYGYYTASVHEGLHCLGFISKTSPGVSPSNFTKWDLNLKTNASGFQNFITPVPDIVPGCTKYFIYNDSYLTTPCSLFEDGELMPQPVETPVVFDVTGSVSHLDGTCSSYPSNYNCSHTSLLTDNYPNPEEVGILCKLGYRVKDNGSGLATFGTDPGNIYNFKNDYLLCQSERVIGLPDNNITTAGNVCNTTVLSNDINADNIFCAEVVWGAGTLTMGGTGLSAYLSFTPVLSSCSPGVNSLAVIRYRPDKILSSGAVETGPYTYLFITILPPPVGTDMYPDCPSGGCGPNLVENGDFSSFPSSIPGSIPSTSPNVSTQMGFNFAMVDEAYSISNYGAGPFTLSNGFNLDDHSLGGDNLMFLGTKAACRFVSGECFLEVWKQQNVPVNPGSEYIFSCWVKNLDMGIIPGYIGDPTGPPLLGLRINGQAVTNPFFIYSFPDNDDFPDDWTRICANFSVPLGVTSLDLVIASYDNAQTQIIRSFALDDIEFRLSPTSLPPAVITPNAPASYCETSYSPVFEANPGSSATGLSYIWSDGSIGTTLSDPVNGLPTGTYYFQVTDLSGCVNYSPGIVVTQESDCCVSSGLEILTETYASSLSDPNGFFNQVVKIYADLIIDVPLFTIQQSTLVFFNPSNAYMSGPKILVKPGMQLTVNDAHLMGCGNLWKGIELSDAGLPCNLKLTGPYYSGGAFPGVAVIEDAWIAANVPIPNNYDINGAVFNRNYKGVFVTNPNPGQLINSKFACVGSWEDFNLYGGGWSPTVSLLNQTYGSLCAIHIKENDEILIGNPTMGANQNYLDGSLRNGIIIEKSLVEISETHGGPNGSSPATGDANEPLSNLNHFSVWMRGRTENLPSPFGFLTIHNCQFGKIQTEKVRNVILLDNFLDDVFINGSYTTLPYLSYAVLPIVNILGNEIYGNVKIFDNPLGQITVGDNNIFYAHANLEIAEIISGGTGALVNVSDNTFQGAYPFNIKLNSLKNAHVENNNMVIWEYSPIAYSFGIDLNDIHGSLITDNPISVSSTFGFGLSKGISSFMSDNNDITCNQIYNTDVGLYLQLTTGIDHDLALNEMHNCTEAGMKFENYALVGNQGAIGTPSDNQWIGAYTIANPEIMSVNTDHTFETIFYQNLIPFIPSNDLALLGSVPFGLSIESPTSPIPDCYTIPYMPPGTGDLEGLLPIIRDELSFIGPYSTSAKWLSEHSAQNYLFDFPGLVAANPEIENWVDARQITASEKIHESWQVLSQTTDSTILPVLDAINIIDQISPIGLPEKYLKDMASYSLERYTIPGFPDSSQKDYIEEIALLCPLEFGPAVFSARTLLRVLGDTNLYFNACEDFVQYRISQESEKVKPENLVLNTNEFKVYPNPAFDKINLIIPNGFEGRLKIYDVFGSCLFEGACTQSVETVSLQGLSSGIYHFSIQNLNGNIVLSENIIKISK